MILDAEGIEICVGDIVYNVDTGIKYKVVRLPKSGEYQAVCVVIEGNEDICDGYDPNRLTHKKCMECGDA